MDWFSEKFIEDCIAESPEVFLGRPLTLKSQQPRLGGFIPDLVFSDESGTSVIVEIQKSALDRYHLYKCLEYRDLLANHEGGDTPVVALVCETLPEKYKNIVATHGIELHVLSREAVIEAAAANCPASLKTHLLQSQIAKPDDINTTVPVRLRRYGWSQYDTLSDIYQAVVQELTRSGRWDETLNGDNSDIIWSTKSIIDHRLSYGRLLDPTEWRIDNLIAEPKSWVPPERENWTRIRRPRASFDVFETSKGNLSVRWFPKGIDPWTTNETHDWVQAPSTEPYAYNRPANEVLFIEGIRDLSPDPDRFVYFKDGDDRAALNTMLLALVWATIQSVKETISATVELDVLSEFQLVTGEPIDADSIDPGRDITGWRIISTSDLRVEEANKRISEFGSQNSVSIEAVLQGLKEDRDQPKPQKGDQPSRIAKALRVKGHRITVVPIRQLFSDLELVNHPEFSHLRASQE